MSAAQSPARIEIERPGGTLVLHQLATGSGGPVVVLLHGITANAYSWLAAANRIAAAHPDATILAPDLRGRADSRALTGPWGLAAQADDVAAIMQRCGGTGYLIGHSMGAFIAALTVAGHGELVAGTVLVDGGLAFPIPQGLDIDATLTATIGPAMQRLSMTFADADAYLAFWADHPAVGPLLAGPSAADARAYLLHDLVGTADGVVSSCVLDAVRADGADVLSDPATHAAVRAAAEAGAGIEFLWAARGMLNEAQGLYDEQRLAAIGVPKTVGVTAIPDVNHYSVLFQQASVDAVVNALGRLIARR